MPIMETMKNITKAELNAGNISSLLSLLPLLEEDSKLRQLTISLRNLVAETHPFAMFEVPRTLTHRLPIPGCEKQGPEALLFMGSDHSVVVFVSELCDEGQVLGVCSTRSRLVQELFGSLHEVEDELLSKDFNTLPTWESWIGFCRSWEFAPQVLENLFPAMDYWWKHECSCYQKELARG